MNPKTAQRRGVAFVVAAPSGAGKTSVVNALCQSDKNIRQAITTTTRPMREGEVNGRDYNFVTVEAFEQLIDEGALLEHVHIFGNYYGLQTAAISEPLKAGRDVVIILDIEGAKTTRRALPDDVVSVFLLPPSKAELERRLNGRGTDAEDIIKKRLERANAEIAQARAFDYILVNDDFADTVRQFGAIVAVRRNRAEALGKLIPSLLNT